jgi:hypothetical protein
MSGRDHLVDEERLFQGMARDELTFVGAKGGLAPVEEDPKDIEGDRGGPSMRYVRALCQQTRWQ